MLKSFYACATTAALVLSESNAMSMNIGAGVQPALDATDVIQKAASTSSTAAPIVSILRVRTDF